MTGFFWLGMLIAFMAGLLNGSFTLPMKYASAWSWEHIWSVYSILGLLVLPWTLAVCLVPHLFQMYRGLSWRDLLYPALFGLLWGIAQTTFGLAVSLVGMAIAFAIVCGLVCVSGALLPILAFNPSDLLQPIGLMMLAGMPVLLSGLVFYGKAGIRRDREQAVANTGTHRDAGRFRTGLALCILTGVLGSAWNVGFAFSRPILERSISFGASAASSTYAAWAVVLSGGFLPNFIYPMYLILRRRSWTEFARDNWVRELRLGGTMAVVWLSAIVVYGIGATLVGRYGTSVGFSIYVAATILASNTLGIITGEWKGTSPRTRKLVSAGAVLVLASVAILNLGGLFAGPR